MRQFNEWKSAFNSLYRKMKKGYSYFVNFICMSKALMIEKRIAFQVLTVFL